MMIKPEDVAKILDAAEIVDVISPFVPLKKRGSNYIGCCPFHNEKTPSFSVNPARGIYKCFGCGEGGNAVNFLMKHEHYTYPEALVYLANKYGIEIEQEKFTQEQIIAQGERESLFHVTEFAQKYFCDILFNDEQGKAIGYSYFQERGLDDATIRKWGLGYSKDNFTHFTDYAIKNGYTEETLIKSGLTIFKEENNSKYDRFRARVMFPIYNVGGRPLGFTGRVLTNDKTKAKYVNSPESDIYHKGKVLFGLHLAKNEIVKQDLCYLVEGNMDAVMLSQNEVHNVVATSGTALTIDQIRLIKRYTSNVTILYDGDNAGIKAAFKAIDLFLEQGLHVKIVLFPDGEDPDSYCRKLPQEEFKLYIKDKAENFILFKTSLLLEDAKEDPFKRSSLIKDIINTIGLIPDHIERSAYIKQCSSLLKVKEELLYEELKKSLRQRLSQQKEKPSDIEEDYQEQTLKSKVNVEKQIIEDLFPDKEQEKAVIGILLNHGDKQTNQYVLNECDELEKQTFVIAAYIVGDIVSDDIQFDNKIYQSIFDFYKQSLLNDGVVPDLQTLINNSSEEVRETVTSMLVNNYSISELWQLKWKISVPNPDDPEKVDEELKKSLLSLKLNKLEKKIAYSEKKISQASNDEDMLIFLSEHKVLLEIKKVIAMELNRIVVK